MTVATAGYLGLTHFAKIRLSQQRTELSSFMDIYLLHKVRLAYMLAQSEVTLTAL